MGDRYIYGELDGSLIFLREETVESLTRLWSAVSSAQSWSDVEEQVGDELTATVMRMAEVVPPTGEDDPPFNRDEVCGRVSACWTPLNLMQLMTSELPYSARDAGSRQYCPVNGCLLVIPPGGESYAVLALVSEGCWPDRDDDAVRRCLPQSQGSSEPCSDESSEIGSRVPSIPKDQQVHHAT